MGGFLSSTLTYYFAPSPTAEREADGNGEADEQGQEENIENEAGPSRRSSRRRPSSSSSSSSSAPKATAAVDAAVVGRRTRGKSRSEGSTVSSSLSMTVDQPSSKRRRLGETSLATATQTDARPGFALLGFNRLSESDVARMRALSRVFPGVRIVSASEAKPLGEENGPRAYSSSDDEDENENPPVPYEDDEPHLECDFKYSLAGAFEPSTVAIFLDYFFLQPGWYERRYGENWLWPTVNKATKVVSPSKVAAAFGASPVLQLCLLPLDVSIGHGNGLVYASIVDPFVRGDLAKRGLALELLSFEQARAVHPLIEATERCYTKLSFDEKRAYFRQPRFVGCRVPSKCPDRLQDVAFPNATETPFSFVCVYRVGRDWRGVLNALRSRRYATAGVAVVAAS